MKRCPHCNRVETDDALAFCRVDGMTLVSDSSQLSGEVGTARLGSPSAATEIETSLLPHRTDAVMGRGTAPTNVLPAQPPLATGALAKPKHRRTAIAIAIIVAAVVTAAAAMIINGPALAQVVVVPPIGSEDGISNMPKTNSTVPDRVRTLDLNAPGGVRVRSDLADQLGSHRPAVRSKERF